MSEDPIVITGAVRTPLGGFQGDLASDSKSNKSWKKRSKFSPSPFDSFPMELGEQPVI